MLHIAVKTRPGVTILPQDTKMTLIHCPREEQTKEHKKDKNTP
jgi:hypothetical protein